ncbi:hypothetical protein llap_12265 [Limosa lapponica baueri]|uniref:Uncharacterized protein n=1 Tax=Limosa lapponica baueri TaxID=1758121 RepID=A0A2I0TUI2_LIMLA|nr:hypothetical protein llap_12265 [Limosa lapponica baueri]
MIESVRESRCKAVITYVKTRKDNLEEQYESETFSYDGDGNGDDTETHRKEMNSLLSADATLRQTTGMENINTKRQNREMDNFLGLDSNLVFHEVCCNRFDFPIAEHACKIQFLEVDIVERSQADLA